jgi:hypothetical protein
MSFEDFKSQFEEHVKKLSESEKAAAGMSKEDDEDRHPRSHARVESADYSLRASELHHEGYLDRIVLKFTTLSEENEAPSFTIGPEGGQIGRQTTNEVNQNEV